MSFRDKNEALEYRDELNKKLRKAPEKPKYKALPPEKQSLFRALCITGNARVLNGTTYRIMLETMKLSYFAFKK